MSYQNFSVIIPSYNPDEKLEWVVIDLINLGVEDIIIINDGSKEECIKYFNAVSALPQVTLLVHPENRGKGAALKTAFDFFLKNRKNMSSCVTADGDAQHSAKDIVACALKAQKEEKIILGVRDFDLTIVPQRSKTGNKITSAIFKIFVGMEISDTQTGLRAFPTKFVNDMLKVSGERYEYETNMLLAMKDISVPFSELVIDTIYIDENKTSHFHPIRDSWKIYKLILGHFFKYLASALISLFTEQSIQSIIYHFAKNHLINLPLELVSFIPARVISSVLNFFLNKKYVFNNNETLGKSLVRYYALWLAQAIVTIILNSLALFIFGNLSTILYTVIALIIKAFIAINSFRIQKDWAFKK